MNHYIDSPRKTGPVGEVSVNQPPDEIVRSQQVTTTATNRGSRISVALVKRMLTWLNGVPLRLTLPAGETIELSTAEPLYTIHILDRRTLWQVAFDPLFQFGEAYSDGRITVEGNFADCLTDIYRAMNRQKRRSMKQRVLNSLHRPFANTISGSKRNVHHHYDIGNEFYRLWLDENMIYTCAYFSRPNLALADAQTAKLDHVCRKLQLKPGMQVVEAGCGWGGLAIHMAKNYGAHVKAFNISQEQVAWAKERAYQQGVSSLVEFVQDDWRNIDGKHDAFVSVGMLEHVGLKYYKQLGKVIHDCLTPEGIGLIHTIGQNSPGPFNQWVEKRIFPGAYVPTLKQLMDIFEPNNVSVLDVENLRLHYEETLRRWSSRFEDSVEQVREQLGDHFVRMWRMYLAGSVAAFGSGSLQLFQVVFANGESNRVPRTREHLYDTTNDRVSLAIKSIANQCSTSVTNGWSQS